MFVLKKKKKQPKKKKKKIKIKQKNKKKKKRKKERKVGNNVSIERRYNEQHHKFVWLNKHFLSDHYEKKKKKKACAECFLT